MTVTVGKRLVAGHLSIGSGRAQPEKESWVRPHVGPQSIGGAIEVRYYVNLVIVKDKALGDPIPGC